MGWILICKYKQTMIIPRVCVFKPYWTLSKFVISFLLLLVGSHPAWADLPVGWSDTDIGAPGLAGSAADTNGNWTVTGGGADIWNTADQFNFVSTSDASDGSITAQVTSLQNSDPGSGLPKAGVMFRNDTTAGAADVRLVVSATNGVSLQWRSTTDPKHITLTSAASRLRRGCSSSGRGQFHGLLQPKWYQLDAGWHATDLLERHGAGRAGGDGGQQCGAEHGDVHQCQSHLAGLWHLSPALDESHHQHRQHAGGADQHAYNPNWPNNPAAAYTHIYTNFDTEVNSGWDNYGQRLRAFVVPPMTGNYTFWIASDDNSFFLFSPNESPANEMPICSVTSWTPWEVFNDEANQQSAPIYLQAGQRYYMEALHQQGGGGDDLTVQWQLPNGIIELPMTTPSAAGTLLIPYTGVTTRRAFIGRPPTRRRWKMARVAFSVLVTNQSSVSYQWLLNNTNLPGASSPVVTLTNLSLDWSGETFSCVVSNATESLAKSSSKLVSVTTGELAPGRLVLFKSHW